MKKNFFIIFLLFTLLVNAEKSELIFTTTLLPEKDTVWVFVPEKKSNHNLPVVFMLHGYSGNYSQWNRIIDLQKMANQYQTIIICPDGLFETWYVDSPVIKKSKFKTFFFAVLLPSIRNLYKIDERNIFITGLSMGGFGALHLFLHKPYVFRAAASTSGMLWLGEMPNRFGLEKIFGTNMEVLNSFSIINRIKELRSSNKPVLIDCGTEDFFYNQHKAFVIKAKNMDYKFVWKAEKGSHNANYWRKSVQEQFSFFANYYK
ncbi:MAG: prolyl oligopeptidase family serine peptidase [Bacteroidales bacterium]|nr:prolyl oligopeptidase family serine peptidase [Bacteroidales bacterium]